MIRSTQPDPHSLGQGVSFKESPMAHYWCKGRGLEIGSAAHNPFNLPGSLNVAPYSDEPSHPDYIDFEHYKQAQIDMCGKFDEIDLIGEADNIPIEPASQDYIISSHSVEHLPNPIGAFAHWNSLLLPGGIIFMILPHRDAFEQDKSRPISALNEIIDAYKNHYTVDSFPYKGAESGRRGHYFVWTLERFLEAIDWANKNVALNWRIEATLPVDDKVGNGFTVVARYIGPTGETADGQGPSGPQAIGQDNFKSKFHPDLWSKARHPYYIFCPDYRENSAGVFALHMLCHALNLEGYEAYVTAEIRNPRLRTPWLTTEIEQGHVRAGNTPITLYPEVVSGNPRNAPIVARYLLNTPGRLGGDTSFPDSDLLFVFNLEFLPLGMHAQVLPTPLFDLSLFNADSLEGVTRSGRYFYAYRYLEGGHSLLPETDGCIELSQKNPRTLSELAELFRSAELLYSYEISGLCTEAMLCGCPVIYLPNEMLATFPERLIGRDGAAWGNSPGEVARAKATVRRVFGKVQELQESFWGHLTHFIEITQHAAERHDRELLVRGGMQVESVPAPGTVGREAFVVNQGWPGTTWVQLLLAYVRTFEPGEPVALLIPVDNGGPGTAALGSAQREVLELIAASGLEIFAEVIILDRVTELEVTLRPFRQVHWLRSDNRLDDLQDSANAKRLALAVRQYAEN